MIKVIIANDNDILYNSLSNFSLQNELNIEIKNVTKNGLENIIHKIKAKDNVIILDLYNLCNIFAKCYEECYLENGY